MFPGVRAAIYGGSIGHLELASVTLTSSDAPGETVSATYRLDADGGTRKTVETFAGGAVTSDISAWWSRHPLAAIGATYDVRVVHSTGTSRFQSGLTLGTWTAMSSNLALLFSMDLGSPGTEVSTYTVQIGIAGDDTAQITKTLTISLEEDTP